MKFDIIKSQLRQKKFLEKEKSFFCKNNRKGIKYYNCEKIEYIKWNC